MVDLLPATVHGTCWYTMPHDHDRSAAGPCPVCGGHLDAYTEQDFARGLELVMLLGDVWSNND